MEIIGTLSVQPYQRRLGGTCQTVKMYFGDTVYVVVDSMPCNKNSLENECLVAESLSSQG